MSAAAGILGGANILGGVNFFISGGATFFSDLGGHNREKTIFE
jgi:hypothetical protein